MELRETALTEEIYSHVKQSSKKDALLAGRWNSCS